MQLAPVLDRIRILPKKDANLDRNLGDIGEIFYDEQLNTLRIFSGKHLGGYPVLTTGNLQKELNQTGVATVKYTLKVGPGLGGQTGVKYYIGQEYRPDLDLVIGYTYIFDQSDSSNNTHPLGFSSDDANGTLGSGTIYSNNVVYFLGDDPVTRTVYVADFDRYTTRKVQITITSDTVEPLYYWSESSTEMGARILINEPGAGGSGGGASVDVSEIPPQVAIEGNIWFNKNNGKLYVYIVDGDSSQWVQPSVSAGTGGGTSVEISDTAPENPSDGTIWYNSFNGNLYIWVSDIDSSQWVQPAIPTVPTVNTFSNINFNDSTQFSASGNDTLTFIDGPGIEITSDPINKSLTISSTAVSDSFAQINFNDSTQFSASGNDTLTFIDGPGIEITSDPINKSLTISSTAVQTMAITGKEIITSMIFG